MPPGQEPTNAKPVTELEPLEAIRTETVFSRLPIHKLAKKGKMNIRISRKDGAGELELLWEVSGNVKYGEAGALAYKMDTLVINRRIDEIGRPVPRVFRLGSQREIAEELGLGSDTNKVKKALLQNASTFITAKLAYKGNDGERRRLGEKGGVAFTRYGVVFAGEVLPDGRKADAVYLILNDPYFDVVNNAPVRPLDYKYLRALAPGPQRFYEILSYKIFAALKQGRHEAKLLYSELCMFAPQERYNEWEQAKKQMYKIHRPHVASGYVKAVHFEPTKDKDGNRDWLMVYEVGRKAETEFNTFQVKGAKQAERAVETQPERKQLTLELAVEPLKIVQFFHKLARGAEDWRPYPGSREVEYAKELVAEHGPEKTSFIVRYAIRAAERTRFKMQNFGAVRQYVPDAVAAFEKRQRTAEAEARLQATEEERKRQEGERYRAAEARLSALSKAEYKALRNRVEMALKVEHPDFFKLWSKELVERTIRGYMIQELDGETRG